MECKFGRNTRGWCSHPKAYCSIWQHSQNKEKSEKGKCVQGNERKQNQNIMEWVKRREQDLKKNNGMTFHDI